MYLASFDSLKYVTNKHEVILFLSIFRLNLLCMFSSPSMQAKKINIWWCICSQL